MVKIIKEEADMKGSKVDIRTVPGTIKEGIKGRVVVEVRHCVDSRGVCTCETLDSFTGCVYG